MRGSTGKSMVCIWRDAAFAHQEMCWTWWERGLLQQEIYKLEAFNHNVFKKSCYLVILLGRQSAINCYSCGTHESTHLCDSIATSKDRITSQLAVSVSFGHVISLQIKYDCHIILYCIKLYSRYLLLRIHCKA